ncbi:MAG: hypothetical protein EOO77_18080 [Oxalobacteraceae bacterium]|jgi:hypothetical protein|nr:MAG: hypothetical protein EOO77_18080 [Oxalobacteraceae bacterium]
MFAQATADLDTPTTTIGGDTPTAFKSLVRTLASARNRVTMSVLDHLLPDTMEDRAIDEIGGILEYDGPTVMIPADDNHLGLEVRDGDLLYAVGGGVWIGTNLYPDMPEVLDNYNFMTSGTRDQYNEMVEQKLEVEMQRQNDVAALLMAV